MKHRANPKFWKFYEELPKEIQKLADENYVEASRVSVSFSLRSGNPFASCLAADEKMKFTAYFALLLISCSSAPAGDVEDGDIIFHRSQTRQSVAISAATHSKYTHMGIIFHDDGSPYVYEAVQPVKKTPLNEWIKRGKDGHYVIKRIKDLDTSTLPAVRQEITKMLGKDYDWLFDWSDNRIYCSELVWKAYDRASGVQIGSLKKLSDFDLEHQIVRAIMKERYGDDVPLDMKVISPSDMFESKILVIVEKN